MAQNEPEPAKPTMHFLPHLGEITPDAIEALYEKLTGRKPTPEESKELRNDWDKEIGPIA